MAKKKTIKRKKPTPTPGVYPDRSFPPPPKRKIRGGSLKATMMVDEFNLIPLDSDIKVKRNLFKRFKDWLESAWFVFFNSYGG